MARLSPPIVLAVAAVLLFAGMARVPLLDPDESRFACTSLEMLRSGDWVVPSFEGEARLAKPPLLHWIQACLFSWFGHVEWAARAPAALSTLGTIALTGWIARRRLGAAAAFWASACLASMPLVFALGRLGTLDSLLTLAIVGVLAIDLTARREVDAVRALATGALLGLACLVKGPVGLLLPLLLMVAGRCAARATARWSGSAILQAAVAGCLVAWPWALALIGRRGVLDVLQVLRKEAFEPYVEGTIHLEPFWFYIPVAVVGFSPWIGPLALGLVRAWSSRTEAESAGARYAAAGLLAGLLFFSLGRSKLSNYILPLAPLAALVVSWELGREREGPRHRSGGPALLAATLLSLALVLVAVSRLDLAADVRAWARTGGAIYAAGALVAVWAAIARRPVWVHGAAAATSATFLLFLGLVVHPGLGQTRSAAALIRAVPELGRARQVVTVDMRVPSLTFYRDRSTEVVPMPLLQRRLEVSDDPLLVFDRADLPDVPAGAMNQLRELGRQGKYVVFSKMTTGVRSFKRPDPLLDPTWAGG